MHNAAYWVALRDMRGLRTDRARELIARFGSPPEVFAQTPERLREVVAEPLASSLARKPDLEPALRELAAAQRLGLQVLLQGAPGFPPALDGMSDPPLVLYLRGQLPSAASVSIVGSRRASARSRDAASRFARALASAGVSVVSGLAYGIDSSAHAGALDGGGPTVAVLASGLDAPGPSGNRRLAHRILERGGAWLSEYAPGTHARPYHFPHRNRLISALSAATLVVEARERSGSLWTAFHALEQGRDLLVVPGPIDSELCAGSNRLLREGAGVVLDAEDLLRAAGVSCPAARALELTSSEAALLDALRAGPVDADGLARQSGLPAARVAALLLPLELRGLVTREGSRVALGPAVRARPLGD